MNNLEVELIAGSWRNGLDEELVEGLGIIHGTVGLVLRHGTSGLVLRHGATGVPSEYMLIYHLISLLDMYDQAFEAAVGDAPVETPGDEPSALAGASGSEP